MTISPLFSNWNFRSSWSGKIVLLHFDDRMVWRDATLQDFKKFELRRPDWRFRETWRGKLVLQRHAALVDERGIYHSDWQDADSGDLNDYYKEISQ